METLLLLITTGVLVGTLAFLVCHDGKSHKDKWREEMQRFLNNYETIADHSGEDVLRGYKSLEELKEANRRLENALLTYNTKT